MSTEAPAPIYPQDAQPDDASAMEKHDEVTIDWPGHDFHGRTGRFFGRVMGDQKAIVAMDEHVHLMAPLHCIIVKPRAGAAPCL